jgi:hypothetical protein
VVGIAAGQTLDRTGRGFYIRPMRGRATNTFDRQVRVGVGDLIARRVSGVSEFARTLARSWRRPWLPPLCLPADSQRTQTIGRSPECDLVLSDPTVSRRHALLRPRSQGWELVDLGSTNGTRLNGWRLGVAQFVRPGDVVTFGAMSLAVASGSPPAAAATASTGTLP